MNRAPESVWDYPRPPRVEPCRRRVRVEHDGEVIAESSRAGSFYGGWVTDEIQGPFKGEPGTEGW